MMKRYLIHTILWPLFCLSLHAEEEVAIVTASKESQWQWRVEIGVGSNNGLKVGEEAIVHTKKIKIAIGKGKVDTVYANKAYILITVSSSEMLDKNRHVVYFPKWERKPAALPLKNEDSIYIAKRRKMTSEQLIGRDIVDTNILNAMSIVPMQLFLPAEMRKEAYRDGPVPVAIDETVSQPYITAFTLDVMKIKKGDRVLELKSGGFYQSAILALLTDEIYAVESDKILVARGREALKQCGIANIQLIHGNPTRGYASGAPYDIIIATAAFPELPMNIMKQLADGGRFVLPLGRETQKLVLITRKGEDFYKRELMEVRYSMMPGFEQ